MDETTDEEDEMPDLSAPAVGINKQTERTATEADATLGQLSNYDYFLLRIAGMLLIALFLTMDHVRSFPYIDVCSCW